MTNEKHNNLIIPISKQRMYMPDDGLIIPITPHRDADDEIYYMGRLQCPGSINFVKGAYFQVFLLPEAEYLQIIDYSDGDSYINRSIYKGDCISDYVGKLKFPGSVSLQCSVTFLIFISNKNQEEIQIATSKKR